MPDIEKVIKDLEKYRDREFVKEGITIFDSDPRYRKMIINDAIVLLKEQQQIVRCKDCKHYKDGKCFYTMRRHGLEDDWFCADGELR
jgi:hypothetical protein